MKPIIEVKNLYKKYRIGLKQPYYSLRDNLMELMRNPFMFKQKKIRKDGLLEDEFWALKDISFNVLPGEAIGIIGLNGAGKTTLLKLLSQITPPTYGEITLRGRVASLLEVGTGFHPELTGRENIYLNGAILGMKQREIKKRFDEIVDFAEIEKFLDTPVKHYSSGMYMRLAFAVAAHLNAEILLIDEVLAVGDGLFQKKCLGKMENAIKKGRTIIFVSHNLGAIQGLCNKIIWIEKGMLKEYGDPVSIINNYTQYLFSKKIQIENENIIIEALELRNQQGKITSSFFPGDELNIHLSYQTKKRIEKPHFWFSVQSQSGPCFGANMLLDGNTPTHIVGRGKLVCRFYSLPLLPQSYTIKMAIRGKDGKTGIIEPREIISFNVIGDLKDYNYKGEIKETLVSKSVPVVIPYEWRLPNGKVSKVSLNNKKL